MEDIGINFIRCLLFYLSLPVFMSISFSLFGLKFSIESTGKVNNDGKTDNVLAYHHDELLKTLLTVKNLIEEKTSGQNHFLSNPPSLLSLALKLETRMAEKIIFQRADKIALSREVVLNHILDGDRIFVDSGSTIDQVPSLLSLIGKNVHIHTNNILAALTISKQRRETVIKMMGGNISSYYTATYYNNPYRKLKRLRLDKIILASRIVSFREGFMVNYEDQKNWEYKSFFARKAFNSNGKIKLIVVVDWTKFRRKGEYDRPVLSRDAWETFRNSENFSLIISEPPGHVHTKEAKYARQEIEKFRDQGVIVHSIIGSFNEQITYGNIHNN